ncbi:MAG: Asp-tRNA(Asn)/Glu-tRNA(Gln) amidotransferase subunit GatB [Capsulimonadales bacterium]|nr:Asp-tRNA(Asn)/Glu-tRNA(Gln) amidotransferase subunit GatB [Capsulimonadales bacterium]
MEYEVSVGMECHAELLTRSKMFCGCANAFGGTPNTRVCPVCLGLPGSLPVFNKKAVEHVVRTALALNCEISLRTIFHRKNYFYPDLPKGYQISQYGNTPIGINGYLEIELPEGTLKPIRITRVHLEEDTGKSLHVDGMGYSVMDYNRSGVPLMEIVTAFPPDVRSGEEAALYAESLRSVLLYLGVSDGRMEQGSLRAEPNPSVRPKGSEVYGTKTELKNLNSFRAVRNGVEFEVRRHIALIESGGKVLQGTYGWNEEKGETFLQRVKEVEQEYRYFPEPDLIPIDFDEAFIEEMRRSIPELPLPKKHRLMREYGLPSADAALLVQEIATADYFEAAAKATNDPKAVANWMLGDLTRLANTDVVPVHSTPITAAHLAELVTLIEKGTITGKIGKNLIEDMYRTGKSAARLVEEQGLKVTGADEVAGIVAKVLAANPEVVAKIKGGKAQSKGFLVGQVMKEAKGQARPDDVNRLIDEALENA